MPNFPRSYLDQLQENMDKLTGVRDVTKMLSDINRSVGSIGQRELQMVQEMSQLTEADRVHRSLGLNQMEVIRKAMLQDQTEQMQCMLGIHHNSIAEQAKQLLDAEQHRRIEDVVRMQKALEQSSRPAWIDTLQLDLASNSLLMGAAQKAIRPASMQFTDILRQQLSAIDQGIAGYLGPAALEPIQRMFGPLTTAEMLAAYEHEYEGAERQTRAALESMGESVRDAESVQQMVLMLVDAIHKSKEPFVQRALFVILWPLFVMLMGVALAPIADHYIKKRLNESPQESAKAVQSRATDAVGGLTQLIEYRYVSAQHLNVRENPRANSPSVAELQFGQAVRVVEKGNDFTLVTWSSADGSAFVRGWVFSRYLKKFK